jgi:Ser/Thr protein kinase RdoA (MazF antagonist)
MLISELVAVRASLDEQFQCPLGQAAARRWGCARAIFIRSSASHVFVADGSFDGPRVILRMRPKDQHAETLLRWSSWAAAALKNVGAAVSGPVPSRNGALVERVDGYLVTALEAVEGDVRDSGTLDEQSARTWGALLADLHTRGGSVARPSSVPPFATARASQIPAHLPRTSRVYGLLHGDPEIDNVVWTDTSAAFVDFDDVHYGWYIGDIAFALRDWAAPAAAPDLTMPVPAAFLDGYQRHRRLTADVLSWLPLFARASAVETLVRLKPVLAEPARDDWPPWAHEVHRRVHGRAEELRQALA